VQLAGDRERDGGSWQSEEARAVALVAARAGRDAALDSIDVNAITPLDALNLLSLLKEK
jgi:hypothetical protein